MGDIVTATLLIANLAPHPADDLVVTLPLPDGAVAVPDGKGALDPRGWSWALGTLAGQQRVTVTAVMRLTRMPTGEALLLLPEATARQLSEPVIAAGGALVDERVPPGQATSADGADSVLDGAAPLVAFAPGAATTIRSPGGRVEVRVPPNAHRGPLQLRFRYPEEAEPELIAAGKPLPSRRANGRHGFGTFHLDAADDAGTAVHQFDAPLTIVARYTPEQLRVLGMHPGQLTFFWFDPDQTTTQPDGTVQQGVWVPIPSAVDAETQTVSATVDHLSAFQLGNGLSPSTAFIPSLQGWQVSTFTGAATFSYPMDVPAGPGGLKPNVTLSYSSNANDGPGGTNDKLQASWVGRGWSLDPAGAIALSKNTCCPQWDHFSLTAMGKSFTVVRGTARNGGTDTNNLSLWNWHIVDEAYWKIIANSNNTWTAWSPDGLRYEFTQPLRWGWKGSPADTYETYKWLLTAVIDPSGGFDASNNPVGNRISFEYVVDTLNPYGSPIDPTYRLFKIKWGYDGATPGTGTARYELEFVAPDRQTSPTAGVDVQWDFAANQVYTNPNDPGAPAAGAGSPHEKYRLDEVIFRSGGVNVTRWKLDYATAANSVKSDGVNGQRMLTLTTVTRHGWNTTNTQWNALPATSFTYGMSRGTTSPTPPTAGWNRLLTATNGYGGKVTYTYGHIWSPAGYGGEAIPSGEGYYEGSPYAYRFRVLERKLEDTSGQSYSASTLTTYAYTTPALNTRGHSAMVWYALYPPPFGGDSTAYLATPEKGEFRGHEHVTTRVYDGATTAAPLLQRSQEWFYQGRQLPSACSPSLIPGATSSEDYVDITSSCFQTMLKNEAWRGRVYKSEVQDAAGVALQRTETSYHYVELPFYNSTQVGGYRRAGLWRAFTGQAQVIATTLSGGNTSSQRTETFYAANCGTGAPTAYGQVTCIKEYDQQNTLVRKTTHAYAVKDSFVSTAYPTQPTYIVDRNSATAIQDSTDTYLAFSQRFYDGNNTSYGVLGIKGQLTRAIQVFNIGGLTNASMVNVTLNGTDQTMTSDGRGMPSTQVSYDGAGWVKWTGTAWQASSPGNGSTARTTTTSYHNSYRHLPIQAQYPLSVSGTPLTEAATYDTRLGVLSSVTDFNGNVTSATYDVHGRLETIRKPGDSSGVPTLKASYNDTGQSMQYPFHYRIEQRDSSTESRVTSLFYDGLGRQIQTKVESSTSSELRNLVTDSRFDGLGRATRQSQTREVVEASTTAFDDYTVPSATDAVMRWTKTSYDLAGRVSLVQAYDPTAGSSWRSTTHSYALALESTGNYWFKHTSTDDLSHQREEYSDSLGRLRKVVEVQGSGNATTRYTYDALDQLIQVQDHAGNLTKMVYDSLGRKARMEEPNMGGAVNAWTYAYWADGTLWRQTDARNQSICFFYDAMDRLTTKDFVSGASCPTSVPASPDASYTYDVGTNGKGQRTGMSTSATSTSWLYDSRGRMTKATHTISGASGTRIFEWGYDSADRVSFLKYPTVNSSVEQVNYTYDAAWRQTSVCGTVCYVSTASYNALNQPTRWDLQNGITQSWTYNERGFLATMILGPTSGNLAGLIDRRYTYDGVGNVTKIKNYKAVVDPQVFHYDERDRLTRSSAIEVPIPSGTVVTVRAMGTNVSGWPTMQLRINGTVVQTWTVNSASWANYTYTLTTAIQPGDLVDIVFTNDFTSGSVSRDLFVDYIQFGAVQTVQAEARGVTYDQNATDGQEVYASDGAMLSNGALRLSQQFGYDGLGNLTSKAGASFSYGTQLSGCADGALSKPHALIGDGSAGYCYDKNGNMVSGAGRTITWNTENLPSSVVSGGVTESYTYNADSGRVKVVRGTTTTIYVEGLYEEVIGGAIKKYYTLNGATVAVREQSGSTSTVTYIHGDHLGTVSAVTNTSGTLTQQEYDPWGRQRLTASQTTGNITQTSRAYTGQILDGTGLMFYNARSYDPRLGRFLSADTVVPGSPSGSMDGVAVTPLTVDFHEGGFRAKLAQENALGFWFQLSDAERGQHGSPMGPAQVQSLNRYSYVLNNPLRYTDPTGHVGVTDQGYRVIYHLSHEEAVWLWNFLGDQFFQALDLFLVGVRTVAEAIMRLDKYLMKLNLGLLGALIADVVKIGLFGSALATAAEIIMAIIIVLGAFAGLLKYADWAYGERGVDIHIYRWFPALTLSPPTVERQTSMLNDPGVHFERGAAKPKYSLHL